MTRLSQWLETWLPGRLSPPLRSRLLTRPFLILLTLTLLGFTFEHLLRPVVPLLIIDRGGDVVLVGVVAAMHSLPSILFRPAIGRLVDTWSHAVLLRAGALVAALAPIGLLIPGLLALVAIRFAQGSAWALYSVSTHALMAKRSPVDRRGEASGYFMAMPALAVLIGPAVGVSLYLEAGIVAPALLAATLGFIAVAIALRIRMPPPVEAPPPPASTSILDRLIEPSALPATVMITTFMVPHTIFTIFPPVYALSVGASVELLALYYPVYGSVMFLSQLLAGRVSDRYGRRTAILAGCAIAVVGLMTAIAGAGLVTFALGAGAYAVGVALVSPTMSALTIDRAPAGRLGSAMATYSVGYQLATGMSSLMWGLIISAAGFTAALLVAIGFQAATAALSLRFASTGSWHAPPIEPV